MFKCYRDYGYDAFDRYIPDTDIFQEEINKISNQKVDTEEIFLEGLGLVTCIKQDYEPVIPIALDLTPLVKKRKRHFVDNFLVHKCTGALCFPMNYNYYDKDNDTIVDDICIKVLQKFKKVWFGKYFNKSINFLPSNIEEIRLGLNFSKPLTELPSELKSLYLHSNVSLDNLSQVIENLYLGGIFNLPINNLPDGVKKICINSEFFNYPIDNLPNTIEELYLHGYFNQPIDNLPNSLKKLVVNCENYTHNLTNLPSNLEILEISNGFVGTLKIPLSTKILKFYDYDMSIENLLNEGLKEFYVEGKFNQPLNNGKKSFLPSTLKKLYIKSSHSNMSSFNQNLEFLPDELENLEINLSEDYSFDINSLPSSLKLLDICRESYENKKIFTIKVLPNNIEVLRLNISTGCFIPQIPNSCKTLSCFISKQVGPHLLPNCIEHLELHKAVGGELLDIPTIEQITNINYEKNVKSEFSNDDYLDIIKGYTFPNTLVHLEVYNLDCRQITLPYGLKNLIINDFNSIPYLINLPDSIEFLHSCNFEFIDKLPNNLTKLVTSHFNKNLIESLPKSSNTNIQFDYFGKLERQHAYASAFSFT